MAEKLILARIVAKEAIQIYLRVASSQSSSVTHASHNSGRADKIKDSRSDQQTELR